jgi:hypothetical protein
VKTSKTAESPSPSAADGAPADEGAGQCRAEQSPPENGGGPASGRTGRPVRGSSLGYATAHLGSASVAGLGAVGSAYGLGGVVGAGGLLAGGAASAYVARRVTRVGGRRAAGGVRSVSRTPAGGAKVRRPGGRAGGLLGRGRGGSGFPGRRAVAGRVGGGARSATRKGLLNGGAHGGRGGLFGARRPVTGGGQSAGGPGPSRRAGRSSGPGRAGLFGGGRSTGKGLVGGRSRSGGQGVLGGKRSGSAGGGGSIGKGMTGKGSRSWGKGWRSLFGAGGKDKSAKKVTNNRGKSNDNGRGPQAPQFVDIADSPDGDQPAQGNDKQVPDSRRQRGASTGGKNMGHVSDSAETIVTAIAKADISSARKLDAVFEDLAGFEARVATAKRHLAARIAEEFPADPSISEHVIQSAGLQARLGETLGELRKVFHRAHAMEWERLDSPRRNEHAWDVTHNQD